MNGLFKYGASNDREDFVEHGLSNKLKELVRKHWVKKYAMVTQMKSENLMPLIVMQLQILKRAPK